MPFARLLRFAGVGVASTLCYAVIALALTQWARLPAVEASVIAYAVAALLSYLGHRHITFRSKGDHLREAPRFGLLVLAGYLLALAIPLLTTGILGWPSAVSILATCIVIPAANYLLMARMVFVDAGMPSR